MINGSLGRFDELIRNNDIYSSFKGAANVSLGKNELDITSLIEILGRYHMFGDRTLIKEVKKMPWMIENYDVQGSSFSSLPFHKNEEISIEDGANKFYYLIKTEVEKYIVGKKNVGILLSGGMDSRIVAGIVRNIQLEKGNFNVIALTWGVKESRDVIYAEKIAANFNWDWRYYDLNAETLNDAISIAGEQGSEFSPIHLHAMHKIREAKGIDVILAGSYGDSVGRAEFSGKHVLKIPRIDSYIFNWFGLIKQNAFNSYKSGIADDVRLYRELFPRNMEYQYREIERQCHYMRRMLNPCMKVIDENIPVRQVFTDPSVFGFMWSLDPSRRDDRMYNSLLKKIDPSLQKIPWARTGMQYLSNNNETRDKGLKLNNRYGTWIRNELAGKISDAINSEELASLQVFNLPALKKLHKTSRKYYKLDRASKVDESLIWICSLVESIKKYEIRSEPFTGSWCDQVRSISNTWENYGYAKLYNRRNR